MKMLSVLQRMVENEGRTAIRAVEWLLWMRGEQEKSNVNPRTLKIQRVRHPLSFQRSKGPATRQLRLPFAEENEPKRFWPRRFYDFNVWSRGKLKEKMNYMHANPVVRKLVKHPKNWPWSSWSSYERGEEGLIEMDVVD